MSLFELTRKLIDIPSVSGEEFAVGEFLQSHLEGLGYTVTRQELTPQRFNLFAATNGAPRVVLSTHMDTVPPFMASSEDDENIYGRGACDAKGIIAAQIEAALRLRASGLSDVGLLFTVDEEQGSLGAQVANRIMIDAKPDFLVNGEPTDNKLAKATKGSLRFKLSARGHAAHSAYPEQGDSAIEKLLDVLSDIRNLDWPTDNVLGETTCNIGVISGGLRSNVVAEQAAADVQMRLVSDPAPVKERLQRVVAGRVAIEFLSAHEPVWLETIAGFEQCVVRFTTDIPYLSNWGAPLLLGPGSILCAHTDHEMVSKRELEDAVELYATLTRALLDRQVREGASV